MANGEIRYLDTNNNTQYFPFNSRNGDRKVDASYFARYAESLSTDGVARNRYNELELVLSSDMNVTLKPGIGFVKGHYCYVESDITISIASAPSTGTRIDTIGYVLDIENRKVVPYYKEGNTDEGTPTIVNNSYFVEIPLYNIVVNAGQVITVDSIKDVRKYAVGTATTFRKLVQSITTSSNITTLAITELYDAASDYVDVQVNGIMLEPNTQFTINGNIITFKEAILANNDVKVIVWHFEDKINTFTGSSNTTNSEELNDLTKIKQYYYFCKGDGNDNVALSNIAQNFLTGTGEFAGISDNAQLEVIVCGDMKQIAIWSDVINQTGTQSNPYIYFNFGRPSTSTRTIYFNFSNCARFDVICSSNTNAYSVVFGGADINIRNVAVNVKTGYNVDMFNGTNVHVQDSEFWMTTSNNCCVGKCCGYFDKVRTSITSTSGNAYCFYGNGGLLRVIGGDHFAWTSASGKEAVCFYVEAYQTENVMHVTMANCPEYPRSGYTQTRPIKINNGYATFMMNTLWMIATKDNGSFYDATKCIASGNAIISKN